MTPGSWGGKNLKKAVGSANCLLKKFAETRGSREKYIRRIENTWVHLGRSIY